jgi:hypothetical protein
MWSRTKESKTVSEENMFANIKEGKNGNRKQTEMKEARWDTKENTQEIAKSMFSSFLLTPT